MYGIPIDFPKDIFLGKTIEMISFSVNQVTVHFDADISISIESSFSLTSSGEECTVQVFPLKSSNLIRIIGQRVEDIKFEDSYKTVLIFLTEGDELRCYDDSTEYESLKINLPDREIII
jgi:hypothetical protein